jgi:hypothetical protein
MYHKCEFPLPDSEGSIATKVVKANLSKRAKNEVNPIFQVLMAMTPTLRKDL